MPPCSTLLSPFKRCITSGTSKNQFSINDDSLCQSTGTTHTEKEEQGPGINGYSKVSPDFCHLLATVDQITNKRNELRSLIYSRDYDLVLLTEVCPKNTESRLEVTHIQLPGYQIISNLPSKECKGGVQAYVKAQYTVREFRIQLAIRGDHLL